jgi:hypothetical protein
MSTQTSEATVSYVNRPVHVRREVREKVATQAQNSMFEAACLGDAGRQSHIQSVSLFS